MDDTFKTISETSKVTYTEKRSKFIGYAIPVVSTDDIKDLLDKYRKEFYDARHICWAYVLGGDRSEFRSNDDGEPSGTAGKPILGQINSNQLTYILVIVVRYFGGIKLGTSGLISAYREAAAQAIAESTVIEKTVDSTVSFTFGYTQMNDVMRLVKEMEPNILNQQFGMECEMSLSIRKSKYDDLVNRLQKIDGLNLIVD